MNRHFSSPWIEQVKLNYTKKIAHIEHVYLCFVSFCSMNPRKNKQNKQKQTSIKTKTKIKQATKQHTPISPVRPDSYSVKYLGLTCSTTPKINQHYWKFDCKLFLDKIKYRKF